MAVLLENIINLERYMKILIDNNVDIDDGGNFLINVGYIRVSTDRQAEQGFGLDVQEKNILNYCTRNELSNLLLFIDDGYTGTNMERPGIQGIISFIEAFNSGRSRIRVNAIIIPRMDRLGRTILGTLQFIQDYVVRKVDSKNSLVNNNKDDINFVSVAEPDCRIERGNPRGKFLLMLFASLAEFDRDSIVEKMQDGKIERVASGKWMGGGNIPYGYDYDRTKGMLVINKNEASVVMEIFRLYIEEKMSPQRIADRLGLKSDVTVRQILKRKSLTGCIIYKGVEYAGLHEPIISLDVWNEAQEQLAIRSVVHSPSEYLLSGLLICGECGAKMRYQKWCKDTGECKIVCYSRQKSSKKYLKKVDKCDVDLYWASDIENAVISELFKFKYLNDPSVEKAMPYVNPIDTLTTQLQNERKKLSRLYDFDDEDEDEILKEKIQNCRLKINELQKQIDIEKTQELIRGKIDRATNLLSTLKDAWNDMSPTDRQSVCRELIDSVIVYKNKRIDVHLKLKSFLNNNE